MKKTVIFLLAALMLPLCESLHAQRRSDYRTFNSSNVIHTRSVSYEPWAIDRVKVAYFDFFSDIVDNCDAPMHLNTNPGDYGDPDGTLNYYPEGGLYSFTLKECVEVSNNRGIAPGTYQSIYNRLISCSYGFCVKAHGFNQIGKNLFSNIPALEQTEIGLGVRHLLEGTFRDSKNLKYVKFGPNVIKIDQDCFLGCSGLEVVEFENGDVNSVTHIKDDIKHMFHTDFDRSALYCTNMKAFVVPDHLVSEYKTVLNDVFKPVKDGTCRVISKTEFYSPYVTGVALNTSSVTLSDTNTTRQLIASVLPSNTWNKKVIWSSDNPSVATVSATGLVTYISPGAATITATTEEGGYTDACTVTSVYLKSSDATFKYISTNYGELPLDKFTHRLTVPNATSLIYITADSNHPLSVVSGDTDYKTLNVGDNVFTVTITAEDGSTLTHTITVHRRSTDATLKSFTLTCNGGNIPFGFNSAAQNFTVTVSSPVTHVVIAADANHSHATVSSGTGYKSLNTGDNTFAVIVTAEDGNTLAHTITVHRKSADATLKSFTLTCNGGNIPFGFNPATQDYAITVSNSVSSIMVAAAVNYHLATVVGTGNKTLNEGDNTVTVTVTAEAGQIKTYTITVHRVSINATLQSLTMSNALNGSNIPMEYNSEKLTYTATVPVSVKNITLNARANYSAAFVTGHTGIQSLRPGRNIFHITVTAEDGTVKTYPVIITVGSNVII